MKTIPFLFLSALFSFVTSKPSVLASDNVNASSNKTVHFYVLLIPDSTIQTLHRGRQEEEAGTLTETGTYVGQIISGVLGGDVRPIFAGSASFIDEPDVQQGVSTILANVAPSLNNILKQWVSRAQTLLGISTTPKPGSVVLSNQTRPSNGQIAGQTPLTPAQTAQLQQQLAQLQQQYRPQTIEGSNVISGLELYQAIPTTPAPLPIIKLKPDEDEDDSFNKLLKH